MSLRTAPLIVVAHHGTETYGSDLQLLESVSAMTEVGFRVLVLVPTTGPLVAMLQERGAAVETLDFPVVRRSMMTPIGMARFAYDVVRQLGPAVRLLRRHRAAAIYVNTLILPFWLVAARLASVPALCHVHEAYSRGPRVVRAALSVQVLLAQQVIVNSRASLQALHDALPRAARGAVIVHNGVPGPAQLSADTPASPPAVLALVGRLSPNKGIDVALDATALLAARGYDVQLAVAGTVFPGYEWFEDQLFTRAAAPDLIGRVRWMGYVNPTWDLLGSATIALVPSRFEPFGNTAVEAQLAGRAVVASRVQGLTEIITSGVNGVLVVPEDPEALCTGVATLLDDPAFRERLSTAGRLSATERFSVQQYRETVASLLTPLVV